jgi:inner membrane protein
MRFPLLSKVAAIGLVMLLLGFVLMRIQWIVEERRERQEQARAGIEQSLAGAQTLLGPLLHRSCVETWDEEAGEGRDRQVQTRRREFLLTSAPAQLDAASDLRTEARYRGLFKVNGYTGTTNLQARWLNVSELQPPQAEHRTGRVSCGPARLMVSLSDVRGIRQARVQLDGETLAVQAGTLHPSHGRGFHVELPAARLAQADAPLAVTVMLELVGTARLALVPAAGETSWALRADWPHPSFVGRFLPAARDVTDTGFSARWNLNALASPAAADVRGRGELCAAASSGDEVEPASTARTATPRDRPCLDTLDVAFIDPVNPYVLTDRATKYALLFIVLTFAATALTELLAGRRVHPIQYALVGLALALFYLLLLSLSEHLGFGIAYGLASAACVLLLGFYAAHMMGRRSAGAAFGAGIGLLYGLLWVLLQREQTALVIGSVMLFALLAVVMVLTRRVDWYALVDGSRRPPSPAS